MGFNKNRIVDNDEKIFYDPNQKPYDDFKSYDEFEPAKCNFFLKVPSAFKA